MGEKGNKGELGTIYRRKDCDCGDELETMFHVFVSPSFRAAVGLHPERKSDEERLVHGKSGLTCILTYTLSGSPVRKDSYMARAASLVV